ncbi:uncharacterized protein Eint_100600 [Encephalitozoon intestinalis ATCC 50506]|uniref:Uncharacterized protein n=1 Tax=Encephalitozoon intestinalis (strain ATCC 50506) TaxID=876142 RepID=E0S9K1_ENCIT|nr:uncharacterized protein Eint_100600 [Encephalitozoon intestinalis ATCC 50506]ADM12386.2 hypothetical protein Eint_100600 [Encephalitozoon intestinalis ATCC 50506]UTX46218.1 hypothetical protein GPK93_10g18160 [Encephalitozoon intestinalis]
MDIHMLRKERENCINERDRLISEMDSFIVGSMGEIREALTIPETTVWEISQEDLLLFVSWRISKLISLTRDKKIEILSKLVWEKVNYKDLENILVAEYCYKKVLANDFSESSAWDTDVYIDIGNGDVDIKSDSVERITTGSDGVFYRSLNGLFSKRFHVRVSKELMRSYALNIKVEMGLEIFKSLYEKDEEDLKRLSSYKHYKEKGLPTLVMSGEMTSNLMEDIRARVSQEVTGIIAAEMPDRKKALLITYLLVMFGGIGSDLDLSYFNGKKELYMLEWTKSKENIFIKIQLES